MKGCVTNNDTKKERGGPKTLRLLLEKDEANSLPFTSPCSKQKDKRLCYILTKMMDEITLLFFSSKNEYIHIGDLKCKKQMGTRV